MKKVLIAFLTVIVVLAAAVIFERLSHQGSFGPSAMIALSILGAAFLSLLITLLLYETRYRETTARFWLVLVSISVTYIAVDVLAGFLLIKPLSAPLVPDPYRHHKLLPNTHSYFEQRDFSYYQRVNNVGLRGGDIQIKKSPERYRILMLGDSFTMGKGVEDHQTFSVLLEESLNRSKAKSGPGTIEVLNAGVDSYAPILSLVQLTRDLAPLEPDMVVLNLDNSDLVQETAYRQQAVYAADGAITGVPGTIGKESLNESIRVWTERNLYLTRLLLYYVNRLFDYKDLSLRPIVTQANFEVAKHTLAEDTDPRDEQWKNIFDSILMIKRYCSQRNIKFVLTIYPWGHQVNETEWVPGRFSFIPKNATVSDKSIKRIQEFAASNDIQVLDLFPLFRAYNGSAPLFFKYDNHLTTEGHKLMASGIARYLQDRYWKD